MNRQPGGDAAHMDRIVRSDRRHNRFEIEQAEGIISLFQDEYDLDVTCSSPAAMQAYLSGIDCALRLDRPGIDELTEAVTHDDTFALAHAALGRQLLIHGFRRESVAHFRQAQVLKDRVTPREQASIEAIARAARSDSQALEMAKSHVEDYPQDVFVLSHLVGPFGLLAFSGSRDWPMQNLALLQATKSFYRADDWWHITTRGFFHAEVGALTEAREDCERAWSISENGNCAHSLAHLHFEAGALDEGRGFINDWVSAYGDESDMRHHMMWHLSYLDLENGVDIEEIFAVYDRELDPRVSDPMPLTTLSDNAAFLWRCHLYGMGASAETKKDVLAYAETHYSHCGFCFADLHRAMATAMQDTDLQHQDLLHKLHDVSEKTGTQVASSLEKFAAGFGAFANCAFDEAVRLLEPVLSDSVLVGGSNPQRRIVEDTYLEACMRSGQYDKAGAILRGRNRESSVFDSNLLKKINGQRN